MLPRHIVDIFNFIKCPKNRTNQRLDSYTEGNTVWPQPHNIKAKFLSTGFKGIPGHHGGDLSRFIHLHPGS